MKKILFLLFAIVALFSSCTNDEIEVNTYSDFTYRVSTQSVYDDFNISEDFKNRLLSGSYNIGVFTYIYDELGVLVASDSVFTKTFGKIEQSFSEIPTGDYTAITVEMLVDANNDYKSESWILIGQDNLSTLQIANRTYLAYWYSAVGVSQQQIKVEQGNGQVFEITPRAIGCIIETYVMNFDKSNYAYVALFTKDEPKGRFLSPSYIGEDRFYYDKYNEEITWSARGSFYPYNGLSEVEHRDFYILEEGNIRYCYGGMSKDENGNLINSFITYPNSNTRFHMEDGNTYYGMFSYVGYPDDCKAGMFNTFEEAQEWYRSLTLNFNDCPEPCLQWGVSATNVNSYMESQGLRMLEDGVETEDELYWSYYENSKGTVGYEYQFTMDKASLLAVFMLYSTEAYKLEDILADLKSKYEFFGDDGYDETLGGYFFYTKDGSTMLLLYEENDTYEVLYIPGTLSAAKSKDKIELKTRILEAKKLMKSDK